MTVPLRPAHTMPPGGEITSPPKVGGRTLVDGPAKPIVVRFCSPPCRADWRKLAAASEKDSEKLRALIDELIRTLGQEQKHFREEIEERIRRHVRDMEKKGLDPSIP